MNRFFTIIIILLLLLLLLFAFNSFAEGTKQVWPSGINSEKVGLMLWRFPGNAAPRVPFASYGAVEGNRLHIRIAKTSEKIHYGFNLDPSGFSGNVYYRIKDPNGNIVFGPALVPTSGAGYIQNHTQAISGPDVLSTSGYVSLSYQPTMVGDYYIEINPQSPTVQQQIDTRFQYFDFTVMDGIYEKPGRLWSQNWEFCQFNFTNRTFSSVFIYSNDGIVSKLELNGMQAFGFEVHCNGTGPRNTGNPLTDRQSQPGDVHYFDYKVFLQDPDNLLYPTGDFSTFGTEPAYLSGCSGSYCINVDYTGTGYAEVLLDFNGDGINNANDVLLTANIFQAGYHCFQWDGRDANGTIVNHGFSLSMESTILAGLTHYPVYDAENNTNGFIISTVRPSTPTPLLYFDDTPLPGGTSALNGCATPCHTWSGNFGNVRTINSWWFGASVTNNITLLNNQCDPVANDDFSSGLFQMTQDIPSLVNDSDSDGDNLELISVGTDISNGLTYANGTIVINDNGTPLDPTDDYFVYTPDNGFFGLDSTEYYMNDDKGGRDTATIYIYVDYDLDQDGLVGALDLDSDNDGILDDDEDGGTGFFPSGDEDGDGIPNYLDFSDNSPGFPPFVDSNNDGTNDAFDSDLDGSPDHLDLDSDNDGIPDAVEANNGQEPAGYDVTYGQIIGPDTDNDGLLDSVDNDPLVPYGPGSTSTQPLNDTDGDGINDVLDLDSDNDGIFDVVEGGGTDSNNDGIIDVFSDDNNDGYFDGANNNFLVIQDTDNDGFPNFLDIDSDGDGIDDSREAFSTANDPSPISYIDSDNDGIIDQFDVTSGGITAVPVDTDNDGTPDYLDLDSDGDGANDILESNDANTDGTVDYSPSGLDSDNDGLDDAFDTTVNNWGGESNVPEQNQDNDTQPDWRDKFDTDNPGIFYFVCDATDEVYTLNPTDGTTQLIGSLGLFTNDVEAIAYWDGVLYAANAGNFGTINTTLGLYLNTGQIDGGGTANGAAGAQTLNDVKGLSFDPRTGKLWASNRRGGGSNDLLFQINPANGQFVPNAFGSGIDYLVIGTGTAFVNIEDISINPANGQLLATSNSGNPDQMIRINKQTGTVAIVGPVTNQNTEGLAFYNDGSLYGTIDNNPGEFVTINPNTGTMSNNVTLPCGNPRALSSLVAPPNHVTGTVWNDLDMDGTINGVEGGLSNVEVNLYVDVNNNGVIDSGDELVQTQLTDATGNYDFTYATTGNLLMTINEGTLPSGFGLTTDNVEQAIFNDNTNFTETESQNNFGATIGTDCDGDGIPDFTEGGVGVDTDGDGIDNMCDLDSDNDGILDADELTIDTDNDGIPNYLDLDSDNDGIPDALEANNGVAISEYVTNGGFLQGVDTDGDGLIDAVDNSPNVQYGPVSTSTFPNLDHDQDGVNDYLDLDSDNDGLTDLIEASANPYLGLGQTIDNNNDGKVDGFIDNNNDGFHDTYVANPLVLVNTDNNGNFNYIDFDSDDDGIDDTREGLSTANYSTPNVFTDSDGDGILDFWDIDNGGSTITPVDTDLDGTPDFTDLDSDDDSVLDIIEGNDANQDGIADSSPTGNDTDGDGIDNAFDSNCPGASTWGCSTNTPHQDTDADGEDDFRDLNDDGDDISTVDEVLDINSNGVPDYLELSPCPNGQTLVSTTTTGNVVAINNSRDVTNRNNIIGNPNGTIATFNAANAFVILDFGTTVPAGTAMTLRWRSNVGSGTTIRIGEYNGNNFEVVGDFTTTSTGLTNLNYTSLIPHRFMYVLQVSGGNPRVDALTYATTIETCEDDFDMDGIVNSIDEDDDNDGIPDSVEGNVDTDGDGQIDSQDLDSDNDGIVDAIEQNGGFLPANMNGEGQYNLNVLVANDGNNNGWFETSEGGATYANNTTPSLDTDGDFIFDRLDVDSDGDGILDNIEANTGVQLPNVNNNGQFPAAHVATNDVDNDGLLDQIDPDQGGTPLPNPDTDGDGIPNYLDLDSDQDGLSDNEEGFDPDVTPTGGDADNDGLDNAYDPNNSGTLANLPDEDCNLLIDYLDERKNTTMSGFFNNSSTWLNGGIPSPGKSIVIRSGHTLTLSTAAQVASVTVEPGATLNLAGKTLSVTGRFQVDGTFTHSSGKVIFNGNCTQVVCGDLVFFNVEVDNSFGVNMSCGDIIVENELTLEEGVMNTCSANSFTLKSDASGTAFISANGSGTVNCNIVLERYKEGCKDGWLSLGTPYTTNTFNDWDDDIITTGFLGSDFPNFPFISIYNYNERPGGTLEDGYESPTSINQRIVRGQGYYVYEGIANYPMTIETAGVPNLNTFRFPLTYTNNGTPSNDGWNLLANPYPSAISWEINNSNKWINVGCCNATYIWNECEDQFASYISDVGTNGGSKVIPSSSAFWIKSHFTGASLRCTRKAMTNQQGDFRTPNNSYVDAVFAMHIDGFSEGDEVKFRVLSTASHGHDDFGDALKKISDETPMGIYIKDSEMGMLNSIEAFPNDGEEKVLPVYVRVPQTGSYTMDFTGGMSLPESMCFVFEDVLTGDMFDLKTATYYTCDIDSVANFDNRFLIHVSYPVKPIVNDISCKDNRDGSLIFEANGTGPYDVIWTNAEGTIIRQIETNVNDTLTDLLAGEYSLTVFDQGAEFCNSATVKTLISEPSTAVNVTSIVEDLKCNGDLGQINVNLGGGVAPYSYVWSNGEKTQDITGIEAGDYSITVEDQNGCVKTETFNVATTNTAIASFEINSDTISLSDNPFLEPYNNSSATEYTWIWGDGSTYNGAQPTHQYQEAGTYDVELIAYNKGCTDVMTKTITVVNFRETLAHKTNAIIYADGLITLYFSELTSGEYDLNILDAQGKLVLSKKGELQDESQVSIQAQDLSKGSYIVSCLMNGKLTKEKLAIVR